MAITDDTKDLLESSVYGESSCIIAKRGYGKSHTARVLVEEGLQNKHTFIIIDPQDAYLNLDGFEYILAEAVKNPTALGKLLSQTNRNIVVRMKRLGIEEQNKFLAAFLKSFRQHVRKGIQTIIIDEIHKYAPEGQSTESKDVVRGMFQENRSDGLGAIAITQRPARLDKTILSQADNLAIGRVTSHADKEAVKNYLDNKEDIDKISKLNKGEFFLIGFGDEDARVVKIRKSNTKHSGGSPKNLINEDRKTYDTHKFKFIKKGGVHMADEIPASNELVKNLVPSRAGFMKMVMIGAEVGAGGALGGLVGGLVSAYVKSPIPVVSSRTLAAGASVLSLYALYRFIPDSWEIANEAAKFAASGAAVFTLGSLTFDALAALKVQPPALVNMMLMAASGASPMMVEGAAKSEAGSNVDLNTAAA